jgi:tetratricopeptide (TPR) repeat protein
LSYDLGLLGDALMEQGRLEEAAPAYQKMLDLKPDLQGYARAAHMRWLKGDLEGAIEMMDLAVKASSPRVPEAAAWVHSRQALYFWQDGQNTQALKYCEAALHFVPNYAPALLGRGRIRLGQGQPADAIPDLQSAVRANPLPEYQWTLAEALRVAARTNEAVAVEARLRQRGRLSDPRTYALFLATRGEDVALAVRLLEKELKVRSDVFTHDALAWALAASGRWAEARAHAEKSLAEGAQDARLFLHSGLIADKAGRSEEAHSLLKKAAALQHMLLPSERALLAQPLAQSETRRETGNSSAAAPPKAQAQSQRHSGPSVSSPKPPSSRTN